MLKHNVLWVALLVAKLVIGNEHEHEHEHEHDGDHHAPHQVSQTLASVSVPTESLVPTAHVMHHDHGMPILETDLLPEERLFWEQYNSTLSYFQVPSKHTGSLYAHVLLGLFTIVFVYPVSLIFKNLQLNSCYLVSLFIHTGLMLGSLFTYSVFMNSVPVLYPGNAYNKMSWILSVSTIIQLVTALIKFSYKRNSDENYCRLNSDEELSVESGSPRDSPASTLFEFSENSSTEFSSSEFSNEYKSSSAPLFPEKPTSKPMNSVIGKVLGLPIFQHVSSTIYNISNVTFNLLNWGHFFYFLVYVPTGLATFLMLGQGNTVFNLLAHFIKGGVFFAYGILSLARYSGAFQGKGWAWNNHFITAYSSKKSRWRKIQPIGLFTMEFIESSLILFYGTTNIFLEHLSSTDGVWSPKDLQHASIAFIFIGCGLCGVITEFQLSKWRYEKSMENLQKVKESGTDAEIDKLENVIKSSPGFSPNPFPLITIFWTGILMSKHQQASETSTEIHTQWGNMFIMACAFRVLTYLMSLLLPVNKSLTKPSRPMTELMVSFGLICGGLIFMESTDPVILIFEYYGLTSMFILNVSLGFVALFMGWELSLFAIKDWLKNRRKSIV